MAIADSTLRTDFWNDLRAELVAASIQTTIGATVTAANVVATYNDRQYSRPQIVIQPIILGESEFKFSGSYGKRTVNAVVECYSSHSEGIDQMANQVSEALKDNALDGMNLVAVNEDFAFSAPGENKTFLKTLTFVYERESHS